MLCPQVGKLIHLGLHYGYKSQLFCFVGHLFHLFIHFLPLMQFTVTGGLEPMLVATGGEVGYTPGKSPACRRANREKQTSIPRVPGQNPHRQRENIDSTQSDPGQMVDFNPGPFCCEATMLHRVALPIYSLILFLANLLLHLFVCLNYDAITNTDL